MSVTVAEAGGRTTTVPAGISSPRAKLVYLHLAVGGPATADDLAADLRMQKLSLFSVLGTLAARDVVRTDGDGYRLA